MDFISLKGGKSETDGQKPSIISWFTPQIPIAAGLKLGAKNSIQVFHVSDRDPSTCTMTCCLPACPFLGNYDLKQNSDMGCSHIR